MIRFGARTRTRALEAGAGGDVRLHPQDRLDLGLLRLLLEFPRGVHVTVVGNRQRGLLELLGASDQTVDPVGAVEERVFGVAVQMDKRHWTSTIATPAGSRQMAPGSDE